MHFCVIEYHTVYRAIMHVTDNRRLCLLKTSLFVTLYLDAALMETIEPPCIKLEEKRDPLWFQRNRIIIPQSEKVYNNGIE